MNRQSDTTSELIGQRITQEAKWLLRHTDWSIAEVGFALGFDDRAHFSNYFKKRTELTPLLLA